MKFKTFVVKRPGKLFVGTTVVDDKPRADVFTPVFLLSMAEVLLILGLLFGAFSIVYDLPLVILVISACFILLSITAFLEWRNHRIKMLSDDSFEYRSTLGKKTVYHFSVITNIKRTKSSLVIFLGNVRLTFDSFPIITDRFNNRIKHLSVD